MDLSQRLTRKARAGARPRDWRSCMSDNVAYALLVYTGLQIFVTVHALAKGASTALPYLALIVLVAAIIPFCRYFERRWTSLPDEAAFDPGLAPRFRRDRTILWSLAILAPLSMTGLVALLQGS